MLLKATALESENINFLIVVGAQNLMVSLGEW
jgi:hypothetical protein